MKPHLTVFSTVLLIGQLTNSTTLTAVPQSATIAVPKNSDSLSQSASSSLAAEKPLKVAYLSTTSFDFGDNLVNNTITRNVVVVTNISHHKLILNPNLNGDSSYSIVSGMSCGSELAAGANCGIVLSYTPKTPSAPAAQNATLNIGFRNVPPQTQQTVSITGRSAALSAGQVSATNNPQVALYTMTLPFPGTVTVNFGTTTGYGLRTWSQTASTAGGQVSIFVAGMLASTTYHMQAAVMFSNGINATDADHTFSTGAVPGNMQLPIETTTAPGMTPQPGLELIDALGGTPTGVLITDLSGNILWTYANPGNANLNFIDGVQMLPNGNMLMVIGPTSSEPLSGPIPNGTVNEIREVNLAGDTVNAITIDGLNTALAAANCAECNVKLDTFHHDVVALPNGHLLLLANTTMALSPTTTPPLTNAGNGTTTVLGDVIVDVDQDMKPVWVWNTFLHLDPNRHPFTFPDWTHANAVVYSKDDGNIIFSMRHQNWVLKLNYADGTGDGSILWHLGQGGDFTLMGGTDPTDWEYAQHGPNFFGTNTSGVFSLGLMDNGNDRIFPAGVTCGTAGAPPCLYSTVPIWQIDEAAKTATLTFHQILPPDLFNTFGGNAEQLDNGDVEYDLCSTPAGAYVYEVTQESNPQSVWSLHETSTSLYRAFRIPSMYPDVQW